jgi:hypothetical protein
MRSRIKKLTDKEIELIGLLEERKATLKEKVIRSIVREGMSFKDAKKELKFRVKISCINRELQQLKN